MKTTSIFVFGSNLAGRHGKGAALFAIQNHGAIYNQGYIAGYKQAQKDIQCSIGIHNLD